MGKEEDCVRVVEESIAALGGLDIVISNAVSTQHPGVDCMINPIAPDMLLLYHSSILTPLQGYTRFSLFSDLTASTTDDWDTCFAVNVKAQTHLLRTALPTFKSNTEGGVFIMTSSIAGRNTGGSSMPYSVTKAAQLHLMRCLAATQGPKVRVNAVLPGFLRTEWVRTHSSTVPALLRLAIRRVRYMVSN